MSGDRKFQTSFSSGEIDPALQERVDLQRYQSGLNTARNVNVTKRGTLVTRAGRRYIRSVSVDSLGEVVMTPLNNGKFLEWGTLEDLGNTKRYVRGHDYDQSYNTVLASGNLTNETYSKFKTVQINKEQILAVSQDLSGRVFDIADTLDIAEPENTSFLQKIADPFYNFITSIPTIVTATGTGYLVEYTIYEVLTNRDADGMENRGYSFSGASLKIPVTAGTLNEFNFTAPSGEVKEVRIYRKPVNGGAPGYIGSAYPTKGSPDTFTFVDFGQAADFTHTPPLDILEDLDTINDSGIIAAGTYQQRLLVAVDDTIYASYTGIPRHFKRNFPYDDVSGLVFKPSSSKSSKVLHIMDYNGLLVFTEKGLFYHKGILGPLNLVCDYQGPWRIDDFINPIEVPGAVLFIDASTNTVRELQYSDSYQRLTASEVSIFSDHLFENNRITSWAFQDGELPLLHVTFSDGTYATFTFQLEHEMRSWTRCDSQVGIKQVISLPKSSESIDANTRFDSDIIFLCEYADGSLHFEASIPRYLKPQEIDENPESDKGQVIARMDSVVSWSHLLLDELDPGDTITLAPVVPGDWEGDLTLTSTQDIFILSPAWAAVGKIWRWFNPIDRTSIDLEVVSIDSDFIVTLTPSREFPSAYALNPRLYETKTNFDGLDHMEGEDVAIIGDGYVVASPNNNVEDFDTYTVASGEVTLDEPYAIVHVGRPVTADIETLSITEVGQGRGVMYTREESITCNRVFIKVKDTRGLFVGNRFPTDDKVQGQDLTGTNMLKLDGFSSYDVNYENELEVIGNRYDQPITRRAEITLPGDWDSRGKICLRQVDPVHFEILSIVPDIDVTPIGG